MSIPWTNGGLEALVRKAREKQAEVLSEAAEIVTELAEDGAMRMQENLERAVTKTGLARAERGGHPGRIRSGDMHAAVDSRTISSLEGADGAASEGIITGLYGWQDPKDYFLAQEYGPESGQPDAERIPPAHSLGNAHIYVNGQLPTRLKRLKGGTL